MWVTTFACAQREARRDGSDLAGRTVRLSVKNNLKGSRIRVRMGNLYGKENLKISRMSVWNGLSEAVMTFGGKEGLVLPGGETIWSDDTLFCAEPGDILKVLIYFAPDCPYPLSGSGTWPVQYSSPGDKTDEPAFPASRQLLSPSDPEHCEIERVERPFAVLPALMNIDLDCEEGSAVAVFGDSITQMRYWTDRAEERMRKKDPGKYSLLNLGINGARMLLDTGGKNFERYGEIYGEAGRVRAQWDLYPLSGVRYVLFAMGINDISQPSEGTMGPPVEERCTAEDFLNEVKQFAADCAARGMKIAACSITPFGGMHGDCAETEELRRVCNAGMAQMAQEGILAGYIDFSAQVEDPEHPGHLLAVCDSGDHLHPGPEGGRRMELAFGS